MVIKCKDFFPKLLYLFCFNLNVHILLKYEETVEKQCYSPEQVVGSSMDRET